MDATEYIARVFSNLGFSTQEDLFSKIRGYINDEQLTKHVNTLYPSPGYLGKY